MTYTLHFILPQSKLLNFGEAFKNCFGSLFEVGAADSNLVQALGKQLQNFAKATSGSEVSEEARAVIQSIGGFEEIKVGDYNRKAGGVDSNAAILKLRMKKNGSQYSPRSETLKQAFAGYYKKQKASINEIIQGKVSRK